MKDTALGYVRRVFGSSNTEKAFRVHLPDDSEKKVRTIALLINIQDFFENDGVLGVFYKTLVSFCAKLH